MAKYSNSLSVKEAKKAVYDSIRTYGKKPFCIDEHLKRLKNSASLLGFELPETLESIQKKILHDINTAPFEPIFLKVIATPDNVWIEIRPLLIDPSIYKGVRVMTVNCTRDLVKCKKMYAPEVEAAYEKAVSQGYYEALLMDEHGYITEGTRSNILWVSSNTLFFCDHALSGITQAAVLKIAKEKGVSIREAKLHFDELSACDELFLTQTSRGIVPIGEVARPAVRNGESLLSDSEWRTPRPEFHHMKLSVEESAVPIGGPGPITTMLMQSFDLLHA